MLYASSPLTRLTEWCHPTGTAHCAGFRISDGNAGPQAAQRKLSSNVWRQIANVICGKPAGLTHIAMTAVTKFMTF